MPKLRPSKIPVSKIPPRRVTKVLPEEKRKKLEEDYKKKLIIYTPRITKKRKFIYIPDLYSNILGIRANPKEKKAFLKKGAIFSGTEIRKLTI